MGHYEGLVGRYNDAGNLLKTGFKLSQLSIVLGTSVIIHRSAPFTSFFFFNETAPPEISPLPLPAPLPILVVEPALILLDEPLGSLDARLRIEMQSELKSLQRQMGITFIHVTLQRFEFALHLDPKPGRSEEHTSELQSPCNLVCRLLLEKKK